MQRASVASIKWFNERVCSVALAVETVPAFKAGQAIQLSSDSHRWLTYSVACSPDEALASGALQLVLTRGAMTAWLQTQGENCRLLARGPIDDYELPTDLRPGELAVYAGGTGIAPLRPLILECLRLKRGPVAVTYFARRSTECLFEAELSHHAVRGEVYFRKVLTRADGQSLRGASMLSSDLVESTLTPLSKHCIVCGPASFGARVMAILTELGIPRNAIHLGRGEPASGN